MAQRICLSRDLKDGGLGLCFNVQIENKVQPAFVVRYQGMVRAYLNRCGHQSIPLDLDNAYFFNTSGEALVCATHDAHYCPATGECISGPCNGRGLVPISVYEEDGKIYIDKI